MKRTIISIIVTILVMSQISCGQTHYQSSPASPVIIPTRGDTFRLVIKNDQNHTIHVFPMWNRVGCETILRNNQSLKNWYLSQIEGQTMIEKRLSLIRASAKLIKSPLFKNKAIPFNTWGNPIQASRQFSPIGMKHSIYDRLCGEASESTVHDLTISGSGYFQWNFFRSFSIEGLHTVLGVSLDGSGSSYIKVDNDESQPGFMELNPFNQFGFASCQDLINNPSLITNTDQYYWTEPNTGEQKKLSTWISLDRYREIFGSGNPLSIGQYTEVSINETSGEWIIPQGTIVSWFYSVDEYLLDSTGYSSQLLQWRNWYQNGYSDSVVSSIMENTDMSQEEIEDMLGNPEGLSLYNGEYFIPYRRETVGQRQISYLQVYIPSQPNSLILGQDLSLPFLIRRVEASEPIILGDTTITHAEFPLYDTIGVTNGPIVPDSWVNYLNTGKIPAGTSVTFTCYFNPGYYTFWDGMKFEVEGSDTLSFESEYIPIDPLSVSSDPKNEKVLFFPNPVKAGTALPMFKNTIAVNIQGRSQKISGTSPKEPGIYFVLYNKKWYKMVVIP